MRVEERRRGVCGRAGWIEELELELWRVLRVCFCQPADGAGMSVGCVAGGSAGLGLEEVEEVVPVRVVGEGEGREGWGWRVWC